MYDSLRLSGSDFTPPPLVYPYTNTRLKELSRQVRSTMQKILLKSINNHACPYSEKIINKTLVKSKKKEMKTMQPPTPIKKKRKKNEEEKKAQTNRQKSYACDLF